MKNTRRATSFTWPKCMLQMIWSAFGMVCGEMMVGARKEREIDGDGKPVRS